MTNPAMPELPEPELGYIKTDKSHQPAFSARQMRAALQAQAVPMTEDELNEMALQLGREMKGLRCWGWMDLVRAVEAHHGITAQGAQERV